MTMLAFALYFALLAVDALFAVAQVPNVSRQEFSVIDISEDGFVRPSCPLPTSSTLADAGELHHETPALSLHDPSGCLIDFDCEAASMSGWVLHCIVLCSACSLPANDADCPPHHLSCDAKVSLMDADGNTKDDLKLPSGTDEAEKLAVTIQAEFDAGKELTVVVLKVLSLGFRVD